MKYTAKPKTANPVAKHAGSTTISSAGAHYQGKDKKKAAKQGEVKHKKQMDMAEGRLDELGDTPGGRAALAAVQDRADAKRNAWYKNPASGYSSTPKDVKKATDATIGASNRLHGFGPQTRSPRNNAAARIQAAAEQYNEYKSLYLSSKKSGDEEDAAYWKKEMDKLSWTQDPAYKLAENFDPEYDDEAGMANNNLETLERAVQGIDDLIDSGDNLPEWCQEKIAVAKSMLVTVWDYMLSEQDQEVSEGKRRMSRAAKGHEKYGKAGMKALAKAGRDGASEKEVDAIRNKHDRYDENVNEKIKGVDGKACWKGKRYSGKVKKADGTYKDKCIPVSESSWYELRLRTLLESKLKK